MQDLLPELYSLMLKHKFRPGNRKRFTLIDSSAVQRIASMAKPSRNDSVLLLYDGPCFTADALPKVKELTLVEEEPFHSMLLGKFKGAKGVKIEEAGFKTPENAVAILSDFRKLSEEEWCSLLSSAKTVTATCSEDDYFKLTAEPILVDYSPLTVVTQALASIEGEEKIEQGSFHPRPPGPRRVLKFKAGGKNPVKGRELEFLAFLKKVFKYKKKNLTKALRLAFPERMEAELSEAIQESGLEGARVFQVEVEEFVGLFNSL